jgi:hypothetical protein
MRRAPSAPMAATATPAWTCPPAFVAVGAASSLEVVVVLGLEVDDDDGAVAVPVTVDDVTVWIPDDGDEAPGRGVSVPAAVVTGVVTGVVAAEVPGTMAASVVVEPLDSAGEGERTPELGVGPYVDVAEMAAASFSTLVVVDMTVLVMSVSVAGSPTTMLMLHRLTRHPRRWIRLFDGKALGNGRKEEEKCYLPIGSAAIRVNPGVRLVTDHSGQDSHEESGEDEELHCDKRIGLSSERLWEMRSASSEERSTKRSRILCAFRQSR